MTDPLIHGLNAPCRSLGQYRDELVERLGAMPPQDYRRADFARRIAEVEIEICARTPRKVAAVTAP
jgi:hypothetical protein